MAVNQPPFLRAFSFQTFSERGKHVGAIASHLSLVDEASEPAGSRQYAEQRHFRKRNRRVAIVNQVDLVAGDSEFVTAAGGSSIQRGEVPAPGMFGVIFNGAPCL